MALDFAQAAASGLVLLGIWLYGQKSLYGPFLSLFACMAWAMIGLTHDMVEMMVLNIILSAMHLRNLFKWAYRARCNCVRCRTDGVARAARDPRSL